jgi:UDP-N-acetyl-2-amino-2-deoxyglucuronate dehydrogenase
MANQPITYALIGAAGYIAPRHMKAIKDTGGTLVAACDKHDSVGVLDSYFPECDFFTEPEIFARYLDKHPVDYLVVCTPNYLHYAHIAMGLQAGCNVICEKPVVLTEDSIDHILEIEQRTGKHCYTVLQLREHEAVKGMRVGTGHDVEVVYNTPRGKWYERSWKGNVDKSGGLLFNIGVHLFDLLLWKFGRVLDAQWWCSDDHYELELGKADVAIWLSIDKPLRRSLIIDGAPVDLSTGFTDLHTKVYESIHAGRGVRIGETRAVIELINEMV